MIQKFILNIKKRKNWYHKLLYDIAIFIRRIRLPFPRLFGAIFFNLHGILLMLWRRTKQFFFYEPMFRYRCANVGKSLYFEVNFPLILGYGSIFVGDNVIIGGNATFIVSYKTNPNPTISIGDNVYVGYSTLLSSAENITIGNRVLIAANCSILKCNDVWHAPLEVEAQSRHSQ